MHFPKASVFTGAPWKHPKLLHMQTLCHLQLFGLSLVSTDTHGEWRRLYTSAVDGLSFNRLANALLGYDGPTVLLMEGMILWFRTNFNKITPMLFYARRSRVCVWNVLCESVESWKRLPRRNIKQLLVSIEANIQDYAPKWPG